MESLAEYVTGESTACFEPESCKVSVVAESCPVTVSEKVRGMESVFKNGNNSVYSVLSGTSMELSTSAPGVCAKDQKPATENSSKNKSRSSRFVDNLYILILYRSCYNKTPKTNQINRELMGIQSLKTLLNKRFIRPILMSAFSLFFIPSVQGTDGLSDKLDVVVLDAGHGGHDPGAIGSKTKEKDIVLAITLKLGEYIEQNIPDIKVIYTRNKDTFVELHERANIANRNNADLFISIHANWWTNSKTYGSETFTMGTSSDDRNLQVAMKENSVITLEDDYSANYEGFDPNSAESYIIFNLMQKTYTAQSIEFADLVQHQFKERARRHDRGVKQERFLVLWKTTMPSVLIETGFITNPAEQRYLMSEEGQEYLASAIYRAFKEYKRSIENKSSAGGSAVTNKEVRPETYL